jgi:hypothetical protein
MISVISQFAALMVDPPWSSQAVVSDTGRANAVKHRDRGSVLETNGLVPAGACRSPRFRPRSPVLGSGDRDLRPREDHG